MINCFYQCPVFQYNRIPIGIPIASPMITPMTAPMTQLMSGKAHAPSSSNLPRTAGGTIGRSLGY